MKRVFGSMVSVSVLSSALLMASWGQKAGASTPAKIDSSKVVTVAAKPMDKSTLKPQTTCPVMGEAIDKKMFVDYDGKRIYVCCSGCIAEVKKEPQKYIDKLKSRGESVESIVPSSSGGQQKIAVKDSAKITSSTKNESVSPKAVTESYYTCSMHPEVHEAAPGKCPKCGMTLEKKIIKQAQPK